MAHRGPDAQGILRLGEVTLAHRRLAVIDIAGGAQPMALDDADIAITFNGEIYNHNDLRHLLAARGHKFHSHSDTETLLRAYLEYGTDCLGHLRGMFAFIIHDNRTGRMFGARDPFGKKPLYYTGPSAGPVSFAVASEPRALFALLPAFPRRVSHNAIRSFLLHDYVVGEQSAFVGIQRLPPGTAFTLAVNNGMASEMRTWRYWEPSPTHLKSAEISEAEAIRGVQDRLSTAVQRRLLADVPVGVLLSGGIDSSIIAALMVRLCGRGSVKSFSMAFEDSRFDESKYAREVGEHLGTVHHEYVFRLEDCVRTMEQILREQDEPFADPSLLPTSMLCGFARQHVTVALGGDGGDELFAGYDTFAAIRPAHLGRALLPRAIDPALAFAVRHLPSNSPRTRFSLEFKARRFLRGWRESGAGMVAAWQGPFDKAALGTLSPTLAMIAGDELSLASDATKVDCDDATAMLGWYQRVYLPDDILFKSDRASMAHSLELRTPFLDLDLAEYVNALPMSMKLRGRERKRLLRRAIEDWEHKGITLPAHVLRRPKRGFGIPVAKWFRGPLRSLARQRILDAWPRELDFISAAEREHLCMTHITGQRDLYKELWALFVLSIWGEQWLTQ